MDEIDVDAMKDEEEDIDTNEVPEDADANAKPEPVN
jgi:hypothetical protein